MPDTTVVTPAPTFPMVFIDRLRMATDGTGVTTLVGAYGCPLQCRYCINPQTWHPRTDGKPPFVRLTPTELYERVKLDHLYFLATGGGITFGGGEPLVHTAFLAAFRAVIPHEWRIYAESCLHIDHADLPQLAAVVDHFIIDIKDMNPAIYQAYTTRDNAPVKQNLRTLLSLVGPDRITVRIPRIPNYNTPEAVTASEREVRALGITNIDIFSYKIKHKQ